jgi:peptide deformylase
MEKESQQNEYLSGKHLDVIRYPSPILKKVALNVENFDKELKELCHNMLYTMYQAPGIGLAAPQVGQSFRIFVLDIDYTREEITKSDKATDYQLDNFNPLIFINPVIKNKEGEMNYEEGCLSLPGLYEEVQRYEKIVVQYQDVDGNHHEMEASGLLSVCIQHENDHLDGIIFLERLSFIKRNFLTKKYLKGQKKKKSSPNTEL